MREDCLPQDCVRQSTHDRYFEHRHQFASFDAEHRASENLIALRIHNALHKPASFAHFDSASHPGHWHPGNANIQALLAGFVFANPDSSELWIDKNGVRYESSFDRGRPSFDEVRAENSKVIV